MDTALNIAICEDYAEDRIKLIDILNNCSISSAVTVFKSGEELLKSFKPDVFDLLLTDIYLDGITGIEAVTEIRKTDADIPVAFITTSTDHTLESYRLSALRYIEKPFSQKDIEDILLLAKMKKDNTPSLVIQKNGAVEKIAFSNILFIEQRNHHVYINLKNSGIEELYDKLTNIIQQFDEKQFFQCHKSFLVNLSCIKDIDIELKCFILSDGSNIPISREKMSRAKKLFTEFLFDKTRKE